MNELTEDQLEYIREDLASGMMYTRLQMTGELIKKLREANPNITNDEVMAEVVKMRKEKGWDV